MSQIELISRSALANTPWWNALNPSEQRQVLLATQSLTEEMQKHGLSKLAIGRELVRLREILEPKRKFCDYLRRNFPTCSVATAYRWIENYESAKQMLPERFVNVAMAQGYHVIDAKVISQLPPPHTQDKAKILAYLALLKKTRKNASSAGRPRDPDTLQRECVNFISARYRRLADDEHDKYSWLKSIFASVLTEVGIDDKHSTLVAAIPKRRKDTRGRTRKIA